MMAQFADAYMRHSALITHQPSADKLQWNVYPNFYFSQENAFENVVKKLAAILSPTQCVKEYE